MIKFWQAAIIVLVMPAFFSCASYRERINAYYSQLRQGDYPAAETTLDQNKLLRYKRNRLLYFLEKGYVLHLQKQFDSSNAYFNAADRIVDEGKQGAKDIATAALLNPMFVKYRIEDHERFLMHYYKALNYLYLNKTEDALVEARRISLAQNAVAGQHSVTTKKFSADAFALILQGVIYEKANDINNAFIAYRNAADVFLKADGGLYYGVSCPLQLKQDVLRTAWLMGFQNDLSYYEKQFKLKFDKSFLGGERQAIVFAELGMAPVKEEVNTVFTLVKNDAGFFFSDYLNNRFPIDFSVGIQTSQLTGISDLKTFRLALPAYAVQPSRFQSVALLAADSSLHGFEKVEDVNVLAKSLLSERMVKEVSVALSRLLLKKLAENEVKKKDKGWGGVFEAVNFFTEKADTRNWQSLPAAIYYARVNVKPGENHLTIKLNGATARELSIEPGAGERLTVVNIREMK